MTSHKPYWDALDRLIKNKPIRVSIGSRINKDTVALEAGRKRGSIKKSRPAFKLLILAIADAANGATDENHQLKRSLESSKIKTKDYRILYHKSLNRELMLIEELRDLKNKMKQSKIIQLRHPK